MYQNRDNTLSRYRAQASLQWGILGWLLVHASCFALPSDTKERLFFSAHTAELDQQQHRGVFKGQVKIDQGSTHLRAAIAFAESNAQNKLRMAKLTGDKQSQAHYWTLPSPDKPPVHAYADTIYYYPEQHLIKLVGQARIIQGEDRFTAPLIIYNTLAHHVISKPTSANRTTIVVHTEHAKPFAAGGQRGFSQQNIHTRSGAPNP